MNRCPIAIVGLACRFPDAKSPAELWENGLARRRAFRRIPEERLPLGEYGSSDRLAADLTYLRYAALLEGWNFDRARFRVPAGAARSADLVHWLALEVATDAVNDAGFADPRELPRERTAAIVGNTLTGEFSRACALRLRWPYVRRALVRAASEGGLGVASLERLCVAMERSYKAPFAPMTDDTLAGSLSNTIAGRICNQFDLRGGGYAVDGACASSLLAVAHGCTALAAGDVDVVLAGGVDLSLDPFELVGFARVGALAEQEMRIYDRRAEGFWPGEGCGFAVLLRLDDAHAQGRRVYATIPGWGLSSDGSGGITRPELEGQLLAIRRAWERAGLSCGDAALFEGHGTGTVVGDDVELHALSIACGARTRGPAAAVGSVKANIGHTKAAAGIAGLIKATLALGAEVLPPATGSAGDHPRLAPPSPLRVLDRPEPWPEGAQLLAGVSAFGFGGLNVHLVLQGDGRRHDHAPMALASRLWRSAQDAELFLFSAPVADELRRRAGQVARLARQLSFAEMGDVAQALAARCGPEPARAAVVAASPEELETKLRAVERATGPIFDPGAGIFAAISTATPRIGLLFPGQAAPVYPDGGALRRRFAAVEPLYEWATPPADAAQLAVVSGALSACRVLRACGIDAAIAVGHSLGELAAWSWAGVLDEAALLDLVSLRGSVMAGTEGAMAAIAASDVRPVLEGTGAVVAAINSPAQTVVAGSERDIAAVLRAAHARGWHATQLPVAHPYHSQLMAPAARAFAQCLTGRRFRPPVRPVVSTITGAELDASADCVALAARQFCAPVRFLEAWTAAAPRADLWIEAGPGQILTSLATGAKAVATDAGSGSLKGLLRACGAAFALGAPLRTEALFADRFTRPFDLDRPLSFLVNPCESPGNREPEPVCAAGPAPASALALLRDLVAARIQLPVSALRDSDRLLADLHLSSISAGEIVGEAARKLGLPPLAAPLQLSTASLAAAAETLEELRRSGDMPRRAERWPAGVANWVRCFRSTWLPRPIGKRRPPLEGAWEIFASARHAEALRDALAREHCGPGVAAWISDVHQDLPLLLTAVQRACARRDAAGFLLVHGGGAGPALARVLAMEAPHLRCCVIETDAPELAAREMAATTHYREVRYAGERLEPVLDLVDLQGASEARMPRGAVLVVGGGKGIAAECALDFAQRHGLPLALLGRSRPQEDPALAAQLARIGARGVRFQYEPADVCSAAQVETAVSFLHGALGPIAVLIHAAGRNAPRLLGDLAPATCAETSAPKVQGLRNVLAALDGDPLELAVAFGSVIARTGLAGEGDYALANELLSAEMEQLAHARPGCRCLTLAWSVWAGTGMGERLGRVEVLARHGVAPISPEQGVAAFRDILARDVSGELVVSGRLGDPPTVRFDGPELPFLRFLEEPKVYVPRVEVVSEAALSAATDPWLADHVLDGAALLPAVAGLEAMAQASTALAPGLCALEQARFDRPVIVPRDGARRVRIAALRAGDRVEVVVRSDETGFAVDHFRATCRFGPRGPPAQCSAPPGAHLLSREYLYGPLAFHGARFQRVAGYAELTATTCTAELTPEVGALWYAQHLPQEHLLGAPGVLDAALHALQACIPHRRVLPVGIDRLALCQDTPPTHLHARQAGSEPGGVLVYDVELCSQGGIVQRWEGVRLKEVGDLPLPHAWAPPLLGAYLERRCAPLFDGLRVRTHAPEYRRRPDGKPEHPSGAALSISHSGPLTLAASAHRAVGCDVEELRRRGATTWRDLLGEERVALARVLASGLGTDLDDAATRVFCAVEALSKAGAGPLAPLRLQTAPESDGWALLTAGTWRVVTWRTRVDPGGREVALALAGEAP